MKLKENLQSELHSIVEPYISGFEIISDGEENFTVGLLLAH